MHCSCDAVAAASSLSRRRRRRGGRVNYISPILLVYTVPFLSLLATSFAVSEPFIKEYYYRAPSTTYAPAPFLQRSADKRSTDYDRPVVCGDLSPRYSTSPSPSSLYDDESSSPPMHQSSPPPGHRVRGPHYALSSSSSSPSFSHHHHNFSPLDSRSLSPVGASSDRRAYSSNRGEGAKYHHLEESSRFTFPLTSGEVSDESNVSRTGVKKEQSKQMYPYESSVTSSRDSSSESYSHSRYPTSRKRHHETRDSAMSPVSRELSEHTDWQQTSKERSADYTEPQYHPSYREELERGRKKNNGHTSLKGNHGASLSRGYSAASSPSRSTFDRSNDDKNSPLRDSGDETWYSLKIPLTPVASKGHSSRDSLDESDVTVTSASKSANHAASRKSGNRKGSSVDQYYTTTQEPERGGRQSYSREVNDQHRHSPPYDDETDREQFNYRYSDKERRDRPERHSLAYERARGEHINHHYDVKTAGGGGSDGKDATSRTHRMTDGHEKDTQSSKSYYYTKSSLPSGRSKTHRQENSDVGATRGGGATFSYQSNTSDEPSSSTYNSKSDHATFNRPQMSPLRDSHSLAPPPPPPPPSTYSSSSSSDRAKKSTSGHHSAGKWSEKAALGFKRKSNYRPDDRAPIEQDEDRPVLSRTNVNSSPRSASVSVYHQRSQLNSGEAESDEKTASKVTPGDSYNHKSIIKGSSSRSYQASSKPNVANTKQIVKSIQDILDTVRKSEI